MKDRELMGVILAAGKGTRMAPFSSHYPKTLLPICNQPLIKHQIGYMKKLGIKEIIVVIGHLGYEVARSLAVDPVDGVNIKYIEQEDTLGIAHALGKLEPFIAHPFMVFLGDVFFISENLEQMLETYLRDDVGAVLAVKTEEDLDSIKKNFSVIKDEKGFVKRVIEKPRYTHNNLKGCGQYLFDLTIFDAIRRTPKTAMRDEYEITESIQILIDDGVPVVAEDVVQWDMNLTFPFDVLNCNLHNLKVSGKNVHIGPGARIHPDARITSSVIGNDAVIENPAEISRSLVFPNTTVVSGNHLDGVIVTNEQIIDCKPWL